MSQGLKEIGERYSKTVLPARGLWRGVRFTFALKEVIASLCKYYKIDNRDPIERCMKTKTKNWIKECEKNLRIKYKLPEFSQLLQWFNECMKP